MVSSFLFFLIEDEAPVHGETFERILEDFEKAIMPGMVHWNHPRFHAYFASGDSFPSILGDTLSSALAPIGFSWVNFFEFVKI